MKNIKFKHKSRYFIFSLLLLLFSIVLLSVTALGTSLAWFSDSKQLQYNGNAAQVSVQVWEGSDPNHNPIRSNKNITFTNKRSDTLKVKNTSNINVYIRVFISCNWVNNSAEYGDVTSSSHITHGISSSYWYTPVQDVFLNQFIYFKGTVAPNAEQVITNYIELLSVPEGSGGVDINVWAEAVQANDDGLKKFLSNDATLEQLNSFKTALGLIQNQSQND